MIIIILRHAAVNDSYTRATLAAKITNEANLSTAAECTDAHCTNCSVYNNIIQLVYINWFHVK